MQPAALALCLSLLGGEPVRLDTDRFTLSWLHSVEKVEWREEWVVSRHGLRPVTVRLKGHGAGMEPPEGAVLVDGWWRYSPDLPWQGQVVLAASAFTPDHTLCHGSRCRSLSVWLDRPPGDERPVEMAPCSVAGVR